MEIRDQVRQFISANFYMDEADGLPDDASLLDRGIVDSTGVLEVIAFIEETYGLQVEDSEMLPDNLDSIDRITAYVRRKTGTAAA